MERRSGVFAGLMLILLGGFFLVQQLMPGVFDALFSGWFSWPMIIIGVGVAFLIAAFVTGNGPFAIPGCIVGGLGLIFMYQNATGRWESWAYIWALIPGFVGLGLVISGFISDENRGERKTGLVMMAASVIGFILFSAMFNQNMWNLWPVILIVVGIAMLFGALFKRQSSEPDSKIEVIKTEE